MTSSPAVLVLCLLVLGVIAVISGLAAGLGVLGAVMRGDLTGLAGMAWIVAAVITGGCLGAVMWALAWLCRSQHQRWLSERRIAAALERITAGADAETAGEPTDIAAGIGGAKIAAPSDLLAQLRELNVNILLSEKQKTAKRRYFTERRGEELTELISQALAEGRHDDATDHLDELVRIAPDRPKVRELRSQILRAREEARQQALEDATKRAEDLMATGQHDQAEEVAKGLLAEYPQLEAAQELCQRVHRESETFIAEQRTSMYRQIEQHATSRRWRAARDAAEALLEAHPDSAEADAVRAQMGTINDNARLEEVRQRRDQIADLIERKRYHEAIDQASDLIRNFPETAAAEDLENQMPRLTELASGKEYASQ